MGQKYMNCEFDITFDVYSDANGKDVDTHSPTLNHYHYLLWNKKLPSGKMFALNKIKTDRYLLSHESENSLLILSSDSIIHPFNYWKRMEHIIRQIPSKEIDDFHRLGSTIGGYIIFPAQRIERKPTMNSARGLHGKIRDRFDLTLECIRLWYLEISSPLYNVINRYQDFFELFVDFRGYVEFFLLDDLVDDFGNIKFWLPFDDFDHLLVIPRDAEEYRFYMERVMNFNYLRNRRIQKWFEENR